MEAKYDEEYSKLIKILDKRKEQKDREAELMKQETLIISRAKKEIDLDFENPYEIAARENQDQIREQIEAINKKCMIIDGSMHSQNR